MLFRLSSLIAFAGVSVSLWLATVLILVALAVSF
jgi:hypothetical protein